MEVSARVRRSGPTAARLSALTLRTALVGAALTLAGCASNTREAGRSGDAPRAQAPASAQAAASVGQPETASEVVVDAARQPFRDVGLMKRQVPPALARIADPYAAPNGPGCGWLTYEINQIDAVLGPDPTAVSTIDDRSAMERGRDAAGDAARDGMRGAFVGWIPARGVIRHLSGAEQADKAFREAETRGRLRRAYLRGLAQAQSCPALPAAPANVGPVIEVLPATAGPVVLNPTPQPRAASRTKRKRN